MAASLVLGRASYRVFKSALKACAPTVTYTGKRCLLSQAYSCKEAWLKRLEDPVLKQIPLSEFAIQLRDQYDKQKAICAVDMEILANKLNEMDIDEAEFMEDVMVRFRKSPASNPVRNSIVYAIVRNYIDTGIADRLIPLMKSRSKTGIFPDPVSASLLLDHFIVQKEWAHAANVAYELMLQEEFDHSASRLLSLHAVVNYLETVALDSIAPAELKDPEGEEEWIPVSYVRYPTYDDHFDIRAEQYLLGKTLFMLGKTVNPGTTLSNSLQVSGLALYQKYDQCLRLLSEIAESGDGSVAEDSLAHVAESLEKVQLRDPSKPEKEVGVMTMEDEIYKLLPTKEQREAFQSQFQKIQQTLKDKGKVTAEKMSAMEGVITKAELAKSESADIETQTRWLSEWREERQTLLQQKLMEFQRKQKMEEIENTLKDLQEKEELIRFFELNDEIRLTQPKRLPREKPVEEDDEETLRQKRIKRRKFRHNV